MKTSKRITTEEVEDLNLHLLKRHPTVRLYNIININREYALPRILWHFVKKDGHITGALTYDERDFGYNLYGDPNDVEQLLQETLDFDKAEQSEFKGVKFSYLFACMPTDIATAFKAAAEKLNKPLLTNASFELWVMQDIDKAARALNKHLSVANTQELTPTQTLSDQDTTIVHKYWTYSHALSYQIVCEAIKHRPSSCILSTDTCQVPDTEPSYESRAVAWGITRCDYQIAMVHTKHAFRGRGLGKAVIADLSLKVAQLPSEERGCDAKAIVHSYIDSENSVSKQLHLDLGYKFNGTMHHWIRI